MKSIITTNLAIIFFLVIILLAHILAPTEYDWTLNTISDLGAQQYQNAWLMRFGLVGFGALLSGAVLLPFISSGKKNYSDILVVIYALSILMTGFFSTAPFLKGAAYSVTEDNLHSRLASVAGFAFSLAILWHLLAYSEQKYKTYHFLAFLLVMSFSVLVGLSKNDLLPIGMGLLQRGLYGVSFAWLLFRYW